MLDGIEQVAERATQAVNRPCHDDIELPPAGVLEHGIEARPRGDHRAQQSAMPAFGFLSSATVAFSPTAHCLSNKLNDKQPPFGGCTNQIVANSLVGFRAAAAPALSRAMNGRG